jgi:hypothetical protein
VDELEEYRAHNLMVLIGSNPLPNYVAVSLLASADTHVWFLYTSEVQPVAERLKNKLAKDKDLRISMLEAPGTDGYSIQGVITRAIQEDPFSTWSLNYTGGTKVMAVHAYQAVKRARNDAIFSYLDANHLELIVERTNAASLRFPVEQAVNPRLEDLLVLHGYVVHDEGLAEPLFPNQAATLSSIFGQVYLSNQREEFKKQWSQLKLSSGDHLPVEPPFTAMKLLWGNCLTFEELARQWGVEKNPDALSNWLNGGTWLEDYVLASVKKISEECSLRDIHMNLKAKPTLPGMTGFELDVVALQGYQLFVISCSIADNKKDLKLKLFEAYTRARQIGGDEARLALVSCARPFHPASNKDASPKLIEQEVEQNWISHGQIRVFGLEHFSRLDEYLKDWIMTS